MGTLAGVVVGWPQRNAILVGCLRRGWGERIAVYRRRRGLSHAALVGRSSESWLSQVERGIRSVDRLSVLLDMARIPHVDVESLIGRPWQLAPNGGAVAQGLDTVRQTKTTKPIDRASHTPGEPARPAAHQTHRFSQPPLPTCTLAKATTIQPTTILRTDLLSNQSDGPSDRSPDRNEQHQAALEHHPAHPAHPRCAIRPGTRSHLFIAGPPPSPAEDEDLRTRLRACPFVGWAARRGSAYCGPFPGSLPPNPACPLSRHRALQRFMPRA